MTTIEPYLNLLLLLTVLSIIAERITNILKLRQTKLRVPLDSAAAEKDRERAILGLNVMVGMGVAVITKANIFEILGNLQAPWETLGWVRMQEFFWVKKTASTSIGGILYAVGGSLITGFGLSFGSKFWHETLDAVGKLRGAIREKQ